MAKSVPFFYQAKSGHIYLGFGNCRTMLTEQQVKEIGVNVFSLDDFDVDDYRKAYSAPNIASSGHAPVGA